MCKVCGKSHSAVVLKNPCLSDIDNSKVIDCRESIELGIAMSTDSFLCGISYSMTNNAPLLFAFVVSFFHILFLYIGMIMGQKIKSISSISPSIWSKVSGLILILFGIIKVFSKCV